MSSATPYKIKLIISGGGSWRQNSQEEWQFYTQLPAHRVMVPSNITHSRLVDYMERKCGMETSVGVTRLAYNESGKVFILSTDEDVTQFLQFAAQLRSPPTLYAYDDISYVPETQEEDEEEEEEDEEEEGEEDEDEEDGEEDEEEDEDEDEEEDCDLDNYVFDIPDPDPDEARRREAYAVRSFPGNDDFHDMPPPLPSDEPVITANQPVPYNRRGRVKLNQVYRTKQEMTIALGLKFLEEGFEFKTLKSCRKRYEARCVHANCGWRMYAVGLRNTTMFQVRTMNDVHTCSRTQMHPAHRQATRKVLAHLLLDKTGDISRNVRAADIVKDIKSQYKIDISYWQAWRAKWYAICMIEGDPEESFTRLPQYFYNLEVNNPGTVTRITVDDDGRFASCFYALGCSIQTFRSGLLRRVLIIDGAHLKGWYLGTVLLAVAMDANNQVVPIAIGVAKSESGDSWTWFLSKLKECIGEMEGLVFMSDRALSIRQAINTVYPTAHHALCCRHLEMNIKAKDSRMANNKYLFWKACKAYTAYDFDLQMSALRAAVPGAVVLDKVGAHRWSRAHFPGARYNIMTSNSVESMNAHSRFARRHPVVALMDYFRTYQQEWYSKRRTLAGLMNNTLTEWAEAKVQKRAVKSVSWTAREIGYGEFEVQDGYRDARVHYINHTCSCKKWQLSGLPCGHAIAVAVLLRCTDCSHLASHYFTVNTLRATYAPAIYPVGPLQTWVSPEWPLMVVLPPLINKRGPGRRSDHTRIRSRGEGSNRKKCGRCKQYGHTRKYCQEIAPSQIPSSSRQIPSQNAAAPTQQMDESYSHATIDLNVDPNDY